MVFSVCPFLEKVCKNYMVLYKCLIALHFVFVWLFVDLKAAFDSVDKEKTGVINTSQLEDVFRSCGLSISSAQAEAMIKKYGSGESLIGKFRFQFIMLKVR